MRVVLVSTDRESTPPVHGGAIGTWVFEFARELTRRDHDVTIIGKPNYEVNYEQLNIEFISLPNVPEWIRFANLALHGNLNAVFNSLRLLTIRRLLHNADVVQAHYFTTSIVLPILCKKALLVQVWHNFPKVNVVNRVLTREFDLVCGVSRSIAKRIAESLGVNVRKVHVLYDFVDTDKFRPDRRLREIYREKLGLWDCDCAILYVGRIIPQKGLHHLILALRALTRRYKHLRLVVVGPEGHFDNVETGYPTFIRQMICKYGLEKHVVWLGNIHSEELPGVYNAADMVVIPTVMEEGGVLLVTLEAMSSGKPVIAYNSGALREAIVYGETGILVPKGDVHALSEAIELLQSDERLRRRLAINARRKCETTFSVSVTVNTALKLYERYLE